MVAWSGILIVCLWILGNAALQLPLVKTSLRERVARQLGVELDWAWLWWNPLQGIVLENLRAGPIQANGQNRISVRRMMVRVDYRNLLRKKFTVLGLDLRDPVCSFTLPQLRQDHPPVPSAPAAMASAPADPSVRTDLPSLATGSDPATNTIAAADATKPAPPSAELTNPAKLPASPPPDVTIAVSGARVNVIDPDDGHVLARAHGGTFTLGPQGGTLAATLGIGLAGSWRESRVVMPVRWQGNAIEFEPINRVEPQAQIKAVARIGMVHGFPAMAQVIARKCPVEWCPALATLGRGVFPASGTFSGDFQLLVMLANPAARAALLNAEARNLVIPLSGLPAGLAIDDLLNGAGGSSTDGSIGIGQIQMQAAMQGNRAEVAKFQIDAGGALAATKLAVGPGGALAGETTILFGNDGADRLRRIEERLPADRHLGFDGTSEVHFPDGSSARWHSRVLRLGGSVTRPLVEVWPDLGFLGPGETLMVLRAALLPPDPDKVELIPLGN